MPEIEMSKCCVSSLTHFLCRLCRLKKLEHLNIAFNKLTSLPCGMGHLRQALKTFFIFDFFITPGTLQIFNFLNDINPIFRGISAYNQSRFCPHLYTQCTNISDFTKPSRKLRFLGNSSMQVSRIYFLQKKFAEGKIIS